MQQLFVSRGKTSFSNTDVTKSVSKRRSRFDLLTIKKELRFIRLKIVFSIWETFRKILRSSRSFSSPASKADADPWNKISRFNLVDWWMGLLNLYEGRGWRWSGQPSLVWDWVWKIFPKNPKFLKGQKEISSGQVKKYPGQWQGRPLLYCGVKSIMVNPVDGRSFER